MLNQIVAGSGHMGYPGLFHFFGNSPNDIWAIAAQAGATFTPPRYNVGKLSNDNVILAEMLPSVTKVFYLHTRELERKCQIDVKKSFSFLCSKKSTGQFVAYWFGPKGIVQDISEQCSWFPPYPPYNITPAA